MKGYENLTWAPNRVKGQHSTESLEEVVQALRDARGNREDIIQALKDLGEKAARRK